MMQASCSFSVSPGLQARSTQQVYTTWVQRHSQDWIPGVELCQDAAEAPHIDGHVIVHAENDLRGAVETTLNVRVHCIEGVSPGRIETGPCQLTFLVLEAAAPEIDCLDPTFTRMLEQNVLLTR